MTENNSNGRMDAFAIVEKEGKDKPFWLKIGAGFPNRDGSINVYLDALPKDGKVQLRAPSAKKLS